MEFLHTRYRRPVIHRDVKSSNILLGPKLEAKLIDFGLSIFGEDQQEASNRSRLGTVPYLPPETLSTGIVSCKTDVYALGMVWKFSVD